MEKQKSAEWFEKRIGRVTGSSVGAILGLNPYKNSDDVLREMVRAAHGAESEFKGNVATGHGSFHEDGAIAELEMETGLKVEECGFCVHPDHDWLGASPDGLIGDHAAAEIKCPYSQRSNPTPQFKSAVEQMHYFAQMQIEMYCTGRTECYFYQWAPQGSSLSMVYFDQDWIDEKLPALKTFYERYLSEIDNPEHLAPKRKTVNTLDADKLITEYDELTEAANRANQRKKEIIDDLVKIAGGQNSEFWGRKLTQVERAGSVAYAKALKKYAPDADLKPFSGKPTKFWRLS